MFLENNRLLYIFYLNFLGRARKIRIAKGNVDPANGFSHNQQVQLFDPRRAAYSKKRRTKELPTLTRLQNAIRNIQPGSTKRKGINY